MDKFIRQGLPGVIHIRKIITIFYMELSKDFHYDGESHNFWEMVYVDAGNVKIRANNKEFHLKQGEIIFHKPNEFHTLKTDMDSAANVFVISFVCSSESMCFLVYPSSRVLTPSR